MDKLSYPSRTIDAVANTSVYREFELSYGP